MKCEANLAFPIVCSGCQTLYPRPQMADYFDLLGLERCYAVDEAKLEAACRALTRNVHPDRFTGQPDEVRAMATRLSAEVNQAVDVLKDPVRRANYMLELAGGPSAAEVHDVPGDLLMEVMTLREQIEEAQAQSDAEALDATVALSKAEGIIPALESAHAVAEAMKMAPKMSKDQIILINLSGRGDKDVNEIAELLKLREGSK